MIFATIAPTNSMDVVMGHWDTWEPDAIVADKASGIFADPAKVHRLDYRGKYVRSRGPFTVPPSDQAVPSSFRPARAGAAATSRRAGAS